MSVSSTVNSLASQLESALHTMREVRSAKAVDELANVQSETRSSSSALHSHDASASEAEPTEVETVQTAPPRYPRRERLRARQLQATDSTKEIQHKPTRNVHNGRKVSPVLLGCMAAAALATACIGWWYKRRKLKRKHQDVRHLITKCSLAPSEAVLTAVPAPPLLAHTFVTTAA